MVMFYMLTLTFNSSLYFVIKLVCVLFYKTVRLLGPTSRYLKCLYSHRLHRYQSYWITGTFGLDRSSLR